MKVDGDILCDRAISHLSVLEVRTRVPPAPFKRRDRVMEPIGSHGTDTQNT